MLLLLAESFVYHRFYSREGAETYSLTLFLIYPKRHFRPVGVGRWDRIGRLDLYYYGHSHLTQSELEREGSVAM